VPFMAAIQLNSTPITRDHSPVCQFEQLTKILLNSSFYTNVYHFWSSINDVRKEGEEVWSNADRVKDLVDVRNIVLFFIPIRFCGHSVWAMPRHKL